MVLSVAMETDAPVISFAGNNNTIIGKVPVAANKAAFQLLVNESQQAVFFRDGQNLELFGPGRYLLSAETLPLLASDFQKLDDNQSVFYDVYFISVVEHSGIKWGADSPIQVMEPVYKFPVSLGVSGQLALAVTDSQRLLQKLNGTDRILDQNRLLSCFRSMLITKTKAFIARQVKDKQISVFEIDEYLEIFSNELLALLQPDFLDYGLQLTQFFITTIVKPEEDLQYKQFKELHYRTYADIAQARVQQQTELITAQTQAQKNRYSDNDIRFCDCCGHPISPNETNCPVCGATIQSLQKCDKCGFVFQRDGKYCPHCGAKRGDEDEN